MCTVKRAKMVTLGVSFAAALYNMCRWFDYRWRHSEGVWPTKCRPRFRPRRVVIPSNETITIPDKTDLSKNVWYKQVRGQSGCAAWMAVAGVLQLVVFAHHVRDPGAGAFHSQRLFASCRSPLAASPQGDEREAIAGKQHHHYAR